MSVIPYIQGNTAFSPASVPGLSMWLDASDTATIVQTGGLVSQWDDKSGNGYNATQGTGANQPTTGTRTQNGLNVIDFDGSNDFMTGATGILSVSNGNNSIYVVAACDTTNNYFPMFLGYGGSNLWGLYMANSASVFWALHNTFASRPTITWTRDTNPHVHALRRNGGSFNYYLDGTLTGATGTAVNTGVTSLRIGLDDGGTRPANGILMELVVYDNDIGSTNDAALVSYLRGKWGF